MKEFTIRIRYQVAGGHVHMTVWSGKAGFTLGKSGDLCMTVDEFEAWRSNTANLEFVVDETK